MPFGPNNAYTAARSGGRAASGAASKPSWRHPEQVLTLRYEDLVADPEARVQEVCDHLDLGYNSEMLAIERSDPTKIVEDQAAWFAQVSAGITADRRRPLGDGRCPMQTSGDRGRRRAPSCGSSARGGLEAPPRGRRRAPATRSTMPRSEASTSSACGSSRSAGGSWLRAPRKLGGLGR